MQQAARQVEAGGAAFVLLCSNTMHRVAPAIESVLKVPFIHIVDPTSQALRQAGIGRVGLLGTRFTMEQDFYRARMIELHDIVVVVPEQADREWVHQVIYEELCHGIVRDDARAEYQRIVAALAEQGAEGVILGCTQITLLLGQDDVALPVFDTTALHAQAAVTRASRPIHHALCDHSNRTRRAGALSRTRSNAPKSSVSPARRPTSASASPMRTRCSGFTAFSRISRTSAPMLRPCWAARIRKARCTSSGRLRTIRIAIATAPTRFYRLQS